MLSKEQESWIIRGGVIVFWALFWLLNSVDKIIVNPLGFWVGKDRVSQFAGYFSSIGVESSIVSNGILVFVSLLEVIAFIFMILALFYFLKKNKDKARHMFFYGILFSLIIFSFFSIGDQIFGERAELLEHSTYWISLVLSWFIYTHADDK